jgi:hypothetical protein
MDFTFLFRVVELTCEIIAVTYVVKYVRYKLRKKRK